MKRNQRSTTMTDQNGFSQYTPVQIWSPRNEMQIEWKVSCVCYVYVCKYVDFEFNNILQINPPSVSCLLYAIRSPSLASANWENAVLATGVSLVDGISSE